MTVPEMLRAIPATFWGIVVGSLFTIIGVVLTNAGNTKRLRIQHEHEQKLEDRERDLRLRRETYLEAIEAISAGMVVVGRFGETTVSPQDLMLSYTAKSPAIAKVNIVAHDETIQAVANFTQALTGAFLRLTSQRQRVDLLRQNGMDTEARVERASQDLERILARLQTTNAEDSKDDPQWLVQQRQHEALQQRLEQLRAEQFAVWNSLFPAQMNLIKKCTTEVAALDRLLTPIISLMRSELELPFNEAFYTQVIDASHQKQAEYLEQFIRDVASDGVGGPGGIE